MLEKRWIVQKHDRAAAEAMAATLGVHPLTAALLIARGLDTEEKAGAFLKPCFEQLHDPSLLKGMREAVQRIFQAAEKNEKILIWGDYDVDGTTGTVVLRQTFKILGIESEFHIPNRFTEGYGINIPALEAAKERGCSLVISVDCGIRSFEPLEWARDHGLDVIVTDHHLSDPQRGNPPAVAVVNPNQPGCTYPDKDLAGVGVAFKLAHELLRAKGREDLVPAFLKIAAIGTVADIMNLSGENRAIVALGLTDIPNTKNYGLKALMEVADCTSEMTSTHIGFRIAPRINAAGRMDIARHVVELFEAPEFGEARRIADLLNSRNRERQQLQLQITELALDRSRLHRRSQICRRRRTGLASGRDRTCCLKDRRTSPSTHARPLDRERHRTRQRSQHRKLSSLECARIVFRRANAVRRSRRRRRRSGSECHIDTLRMRLNDYANDTLSDEMLVPALYIDAPVSSSTLSLALLSELARLEPFGAGNRKPIFVTDGLRLRFDPTVMKDKHLKFHLEDGQGKRFEAVWWDGVEKGKKRTLAQGSSIELAYTAEVNSWQGNNRLQLVVEDLREHN
jgi:single-stranded-DNA-specific exonuclease